ncbi:hypothetical protein H107_05572 [Trichophyton rubrum CBS 202.88]|nr:hypothetical protein H107_05572 [Trichophyton rubrum CBS 202.88]
MAENTLVFDISSSEPTVYASSGYRISTEKRILDWALLEVDGNRVSKNKLPPIDDIPRNSRALYLAAKEVLDGPVAL